MQGTDADEKPTLAEVLRRATPRVWVTPSICSALVLVAVGATVLGGQNPISPTVGELLAMGANAYPFTVERGEWWRILSATALHGGLLHLTLNTWTLWNGGQLTERLFGNGAFIVLYLLSAVGGSLASLHWSQDSVSVGASGAIFGVYGGLLAFLVRNRSALPIEAVRSLRGTTLGFIALNLLVSLTIPNIDQAAHVGGVLTGFTSGWVLSRDLRAPREGLTQRALGATAVALVLALVAAGLVVRFRGHALQPGDGEVSDGESRARLGDNLGALQAFHAAVKASPENIEALEGRGRAHLSLHHARAARDDFEAVLQRDKTRVVAWLGLCQAATQVGDGQAALTACERSRPVAAVLLVKARALGMLKQFMEAHQAIDSAIEAINDWQARDRPQVLAARAELRAREGHPDDAIKLCSRAGVVFDEQALTSCVVVLREAKANAEIEAMFDRSRANVGRRPANMNVLHALYKVSIGEKAQGLALLEGEADPSMLNDRAWVKVLAGDGTGALADVSAALKSDPDNPYMLGTSCWAKVLVGDEAGAKADCQRAVERNPGTDADEGMVAYLEGRMTDARFLWKMAQAVDPLSAPLMEPWVARTQVADAPNQE